MNCTLFAPLLRYYISYIYIPARKRERERGGTGNEEASAGNSADSGREAALAVEKINKRGEIEKREEKEKEE